jgi:nucleoside-diphosphate kinase
MDYEKTFVMIKPDGIQRGIIGEIITRFEKVGLKIVGMKFIHIDREFAKKHYSDHITKDFYEGLEDFVVSGPVLAFILEGVKAIGVARKIVGKTEPASAQIGTIRGDFAHINYSTADSKKIALPNLIHASDSSENAKKEIELWFSKGEIFDNYKTVHEVFM